MDRNKNRRRLKARAYLHGLCCKEETLTDREVYCLLKYWDKCALPLNSVSSKLKKDAEIFGCIQTDSVSEKSNRGFNDINWILSVCERFADKGLLNEGGGI